MDDREPPGGVRGLASLRWAYKAAFDGGVVAASLIVVLVLAVALAGRVEQGDLSHRVLLWITCATVCWPLCHAVAAVILYLTRALPPAAVALAAACGTGFFTLLCTAVAYTAYGLFYPARAGSVPILAMYVNVTLLMVVASAILHFVVCQIASMRHGVAKEDAPPGRGARLVVLRAAAGAARPRHRVRAGVRSLPRGRHLGGVVPRAVAVVRRRKGAGRSRHAGPSVALGGVSPPPRNDPPRSPDAVAGHGGA